LRLPIHIESRWPYLFSEGYEVTSSATFDYNCIAFAADDQDKWWEPDPNGYAYWPIAWREDSLPCYIEAFQSIGYEICSDGLEADFEKIAFYILDNKPTHAAKQLPDGRWKSKLGDFQDIIHNTLKAVEDHPDYGKAVVFMRRKITILK